MSFSKAFQTVLQSSATTPRPSIQLEPIQTNEADDWAEIEAVYTYPRSSGSYYTGYHKDVLPINKKCNPMKQLLVYTKKNGSKYGQWELSNPDEVDDESLLQACQYSIIRATMEKDETTRYSVKYTKKGKLFIMKEGHLPSFIKAIQNSGSCPPLNGILREKAQEKWYTETDLNRDRTNALIAEEPSR